MIYRHSRLVMVHKQPEGLFPCTVYPQNHHAFHAQSKIFLIFISLNIPKQSRRHVSGQVYPKLPTLMSLMSLVSLNCQQLQVIHVLLEKNRGASVALSSTYGLVFI